MSNKEKQIIYIKEKKKRKHYSIIIDLIMLLLTGGLWLIWILIRPKYEY